VIAITIPARTTTTIAICIQIQVGDIDSTKLSRQSADACRSADAFLRDGS
jgi:hypothetical protein